MLITESMRVEVSRFRSSFENHFPSKYLYTQASIDIVITWGGTTK